MGDWAVKVEGLSKKFSLSVGHALKYGLIDTSRRMVGLPKDSTRLRSGEFWALHDVSFEVAPGESLGIMGVNGSGKTTLLRILNGAYSPDRGSVSLQGRVGALIAAGAGFSPLLSGRENIYVSATLLGMTQAQVRGKFDEIVAFSGIDEYIDMPVRNYSSGMTVRLGFSICIACEPDVLLVDEVLAVGDLAFQRRCFERVLDLLQKGTAIIFVSHSVGAIWSICRSGLFLNKGVSSAKLSVEDLCRAYDLQNYRNAAAQRNNVTSLAFAPRPDRTTASFLPSDHGGAVGGTGDVIVEKVEVCGSEGDDRSEFEFGEPLTLKMHVTVINPIKECIFRYTIDAAHYRFIFATDSTYSDGMGIKDIEPGRYIVVTKIPQQSFRPGTYWVNANVCKKRFSSHLFIQAHAASFIIRAPKDRFIYDSESPAIVHFDAEYECFML